MFTCIVLRKIFFRWYVEKCFVQYEKHFRKKISCNIYTFLELSKWLMRSTENSKYWFHWFNFATVKRQGISINEWMDKRMNEWPNQLLVVECCSSIFQSSWRDKNHLQKCEYLVRFLWHFFIIHSYILVYFGKSDQIYWQGL